MNILLQAAKTQRGRNIEGRDKRLGGQTQNPNNRNSRRDFSKRERKKRIERDKGKFISK
jgi:hypothetical protein